MPRPEITINGQKMPVESFKIEFDHGKDRPVGYVGDISRMPDSITANVKLTRYGRRFIEKVRAAHGQAAQAGYEVYHAGRGKFKLRPIK